MPPTQTTTTRRKRSARRRLLIGLAAVLAVAFLLAVTGALSVPTLVSAYLGGMTFQLNDASLNASARIEGVSLSWTGPQRVERLLITDPDTGDTVVDASLEATTNLLSLLLGGTDLGEITLAGEAHLVADDEGLPRILRAPPATGSGADRPSAPADQKAQLEALRPWTGTLRLDAVEITYRSPEIERRFGEPVGLTAVNAAITLADAALRIDLDAQPLDGGAVEAEGALNLIGPGAPDADLTARANVTARFFNAVAADWIQPMNESDSFMLTLDASTPDDAAQTLDVALAINEPPAAEDLAGAPARASLTLRIDRKGLRLRETATLALRPGPRLLERAGVRNERIRLAVEDDVSAELRSFSADWNDPGDPARGLDLRTLAIDADLRAPRVTGTLALNDQTAPRSLRAANLLLTLRADDLARRASITVAAAATLDDQPAGELSVDADVMRLISDAGDIDRAPRFEGRATLSSASTALIQSLLPDAPLALPEDVGPTIDLVANAVSRGDATDVDLELTADRLNARAALRVEPERVITRDADTRLTLDAPAPLLDRLLEDARISSSPDPPARLEIRLGRLDLPIDNNEPNLRGATLTARATLRGVAIGAAEMTSPVEISSAALDAMRSAGRPLEWTLDATGRHADDDIDARADGRVELAWTEQGALDLNRSVPEGTLNVRNLPVDLIASFTPEPDRPVVRETLGARASLDLTLDRLRSGEGGWSVRARGSSPRADLDLRAVGAPARQVRVEHADLEATLTPALASALTTRFAPDLASPPRLIDSTRLRASLQPIDINLRQARAPDAAAQPSRTFLQRLAGAQLTVTAADPVRIAGVDAGGDAHIDASLRALEARATIDDAGTPSIQASATLHDPDNRAQVARLRAQLALSEPLTGEMTLEDADMTALERMIARPDLLEPLTGSPATLTIALRPDTADAPARTLRARIAAPRLNTEASLRILDDRIETIEPFEAQLTLQPSFLNARLGETDPGGDRDLFVVGPTDALVRIGRVAIGLGDAPLDPEIFDLDAQIECPSLRLRTQDGRTFIYGRVRASAQSTDTPGLVQFNASLMDPGGRALRVDGRIASLADSGGRLTTDRATITATAEGAFPETLLDALADANGRLRESVGSGGDVTASVTGLGGGDARLDLRVTSARASASVRGEVEEGAFHLREPARIELKVITAELGEMVFERLIPLVGKVEKRAEDGPAFVEARDLAVPVDGDLRRLSGRVTIELGLVRYQASPFFGRLLEVVDQRTESDLFREWPSLEVVFEEGVARYERVALPIGEFTLETEGEVDLVDGRVDVVTYVPLAALVAEIRETAGRIPGVGRLTTIPLRTSGSSGSLKTEPAPDLLLEEGVNAPGRIVEDILEGIFGGGRDRQNGGRQ